MSSLALLLCAIIWGISTFLNRLSVEKMSPFFMQIIVGIGYMLFIPIAFKMAQNTPQTKWCLQSVILTSIATILSIGANVLLYFSLKGSKNTGSSTMIVSLYPAITLILSIIFLHEKITLMKLIGIITMIVGGMLLIFN